MSHAWETATHRSVFVRRLLASLALLLALGTTSAQTDYSGVYYIGGPGANSGTVESRYYLCPTESWIYYQSPASFTDTDNGQPFMTTYQCRDGVYDANKAIWIIERYGETNYYYIKHYIDGKYLTYNAKIGSDVGRIRVHLQDTKTDDALFKIQQNSTWYEFISKTAEDNLTGDGNVDRHYLNVTNGNANSLKGQSGKGGGPKGYENVMSGTIGLWKVGGTANSYGQADANSKWYLEPVPLPPTISVTPEGNVTMAMESGYESAYDIYYTTDGSTPNPADAANPALATKAYSTALLHDDIKNYTGSAIKAVAKRKSDDAVSNVISQTLVNYTYKVVNKSDAIAITYTIKEAVGMELDGYSSVPEAIRSMYIRKETVTFKSFEGAFTPEALEAANAITKTPTTSNIYIKYTTDHLMEEIIHLRGARQMNIKAGETGTFDNIYDSGTAGSGVLSHDAIVVSGENTDHLWLIGNNDPYAVTVRNIKTHNYLHYTTPSTLSLDASPSYFILMAGSAAGVDPTYEQFELMAATGDGNYYRVSRSGDTFSLTTASPGGAALQIQAHPNASAVIYSLIDRAGRMIASVSSSSGELRLPNGLWSPLVSTYHYWKESSFTEEGGVYTLTPGEEEIDDISEVSGAVYVTYDVSDAIDITGGTSYLMKFSDGTSFKHEDFSDGVNATASKAIYPYNNGDHNLYIYGLDESGVDEWEKQLSSGASTRSRWPWYIISNHNGTDLTGAAVDPYHVIIKSRQNQSYKVGETTYNGNAYFRTFKPNAEVGVVTGVITQHDVVTATDPTLKPTEYMLLGTDINRLVLKTLGEIDGSQQTVTKFEQYWKNNPTVQGIAGENPAADNATLTGKGWHRYESWAYSANWGADAKTKTLAKGNHWFQTVDMGSGQFSVEEVVLEPEVILLDQHGWEVVRVPLSQTAQLKKYDSPMVQEYHWYPTADKARGYHKFTVSNPNIKVYTYNAETKKWEWKEGDATFTFNSESLGADPYKDHTDQPLSVKSDFYVTYTVKSDYASAYEGAATAGEVKASSYFLKQAGQYAKNNSNTIELVDKPALTASIPTNVQWKVKPYFNIDEEMGYQYGIGDALSKAETEAAYYAAGKNGFDPYNVQIQSVSDTERFFTANTTNTVLEHGIWTGTGSTTNTLREMSVGHISADGYDQTTLDITNATFMVVDDGNGNMRLMPRFDNTKVMTSFSGLSEQLPAAAAGNNGEGTQSLVLELVPTVITSTDEILSMKGYYILAENFSLDTSIGTKTTPFEGTLDGQLNHYTFDKPLVLYAKDATIRNIILETSSLSTGNEDHHLGAIACTATGDSRIYNCGILAGSLSESGHVGGIVGHLDGSARVINCYSYANITGGSEVGGIVGYNAVQDVSQTNFKTMVMNCAFYGDITGGGIAAPVYGGYNIANTSGGLNNYNYYAYTQATTFRDRAEGASKKYNTALAVADEDFQRFEFYRLLLNSNKRLAAFYATGDASNDHQMAKWVLETADRSITAPATPKPYPVLKAQGYYPSIINMDVENAPDSASVGRNKGGKLGKTLTVHLTGDGITTTSLTIDRTDKDFERYNFNYDKIQLPYFNDVGTGNYTNNRVVTGWEITSMTGGTAGTYTEADDWGGYNFADRKCTNKDITGSGGSGRIFSQGAYFDVPYGVTDIYIQPHWATAAYVADEYLDAVYDAGYNVKTVSTMGLQFKQFPTQKITINGSEQTVHKTIANAIATFEKGSVYDYAVVLVGNLHQANVPLSTDAKRFTMMSVDLDNDHEPDYSMIYHHTERTSICPIRFDFLNVIGTAFAQKPNGANLLKNTTIFRTRGWFEVTNTALMYSNQFEYENLDKGNTKENAPLILLGGKFDQFVSTQSSDVPGKTIYIHVGGNVKIDQFGLGTHSDGSKSTPHVPVSVTGGEYNGFYLTGTYNQDAAVRTDNAECYISGGHFVEAAGACQEAINGNVRWQIYNADIDAFYGGGINNAKPIRGSITTEIYNSYVTTFCGGPKFGDMQTGKDVRTTATGCVFEKYFGAGFGGTSYSRKKYHDAVSYNFTNLAKYYSPNDRGKYFNGVTTNSRDGGGGNDQYGKKGVGVATDFDYEFFVWSTGQTGARFFVKFASFSLANCIDVYSTLNNCTINQNFYGGGSFGSVSGTATSVLNGCTVHGNVFGGGYSAQREKVPVRNGGFTKNPNYNSNTGMFEAGEFSGTTNYEWKHVDNLPANGQTGIEDAGDNHYLYTDVDLNALGRVGNTVLTIQGETVVEGKIFQYDGNGQVVKDGAGNNVVLETSGGVFGGGDMSAVNHDTQVNIVATGTNGVLNVFGGGNTADVLENTLVTITGGTVGNTSSVASDENVTSGSVYGGGKGSSTVVGGNVTVNFGTKTGAEPPYTYTGDGLVKNNVYGGSAFGAVNTTSGVTNVNIYQGIVDGNVFGGGLGQTSPSTIVAQNHGNTFVTVDNDDNEDVLVRKAVYGGANKNGVVKANTTVTITGGTVGTVPTGSDPITNVVFGGGYGQPTLVEGSVTVNIGSEGQADGGADVNGHVYGGGALGSTASSIRLDGEGNPVLDGEGNPVLDYHADKTTLVNLYKGLIKGNVYGGGLGQKAEAAVGTPGDPGYKAAVEAVEAFVGGDVRVLLDGAKLERAFTGSGVDLKPLKGQIFGCNNLNGTPKGHVKVWVKRTVDTDKPTDDGATPTPNLIPRDDRPVVTPPATYGYDVAAVYGGGNQADYIPTKATGTAEEKEEAFAEVLIEGCDETSIEYVYGGGNAAAVPATDVTILGTYIIHYVFGGGNGKGTGNPGANIGSYNNGATEYGTGKAVTKLVGGHIMYVFGGSNTLGNVRGGTFVTMPEDDDYVSEGHDCCEVRDIKEIYGAGNQADQDGPVTMILGCVDNMDYVYGGARDAHVKGGVDLIITSGHFKGVFGGNDTAGSIQGPIKLTIEETGCDPLVIDNLYLGGNNAAYSVYGYKDVAGTLTARSSMTDGVAVNPPADDPESDVITEKQLYPDPILNVVSCTSIGNVFGGGYGATAVMFGNPTVNISMIKGNQVGVNDVVLPKEYKTMPNITYVSDEGDDYIRCNINNEIGSIGNVYGGGSAASVMGDTHVNICTEPTVTVRSSMGALNPSPTPVNVEGATITGNVFGAGLGLETEVKNTWIVMAGGTVGKSVYGGGELGSVSGDPDEGFGNTHITVRGGEIGDPTGVLAGETYGNVYGGGKGNTTDVRSGLVKGNTNITIQNTVADEAYNTAHPETAVGTVLSSPAIYHNIYGGGAHGSVGTYTYASEAADAAINGYTSGGTANITITGGTIGVNGHENGMVFGSSRGDVGAPGTIYDKVAWVYNTNVVIGTVGQGSNHTSPHIKGSVYGGGENGHTYNNASVAIHSGLVGITDILPEDPEGQKGARYPYRGNVYGAGCGTDKYYSDPLSETHDGRGDTYNPLSGVVGMTTTVLIDGGHVVRDVYGGGAMGSVKGSPSVKGSATVTIDGNAEVGADGSGGGYVFAAARGDITVPTMATVGTSTLNISGGTIWADAYGGGQNGAVEGAVTVNMTGGTVKHDVYGGGQMADTNTEYDSSEHPTYVTNVTLNGTTIVGNLYGGGLGERAVLYVAEDPEVSAGTKNVGDVKIAAVAADVKGPVTVTVSDGKATDVFGCNNEYGAPKETVTVNVTGTAEVGSGTAIRNVYGGGNLAACETNPTVTVSGGTVQNVYGGGLGASAIVTGNTAVTISGTAAIANDVYGGGSQADVTGNVSVTVSGGTVAHDVYGGGALANTNTANWDTEHDTWSDTSTSNYYVEVKHLKYVQDVGVGEEKASPVTGYYERSGVGPAYTYTPTAHTKAQKGTTYYKIQEDFLNVAANGTTYTTTVSLTGGTIGNAYGGGLGKYTSTGESTGEGAVAAMVYGDVSVTVDGAKFTQETERVDGKAIPITGRVFGCNNKNGTPKGSVHVCVRQTKRLDDGAHVKNQFEIQAVYGGGNMAHYVPKTYDPATEFGQSTHVLIEGCDLTSIERVYGGGNASDVPFTDVVIEGSFQIGYVFGGGNGGDKINKGTGAGWEINPGANVPVYSNVLLQGGTIGEAFGGSDSKGSVGSSDLRTQPSGGCELVINNIYGASKEADFDGDVTLDLSRCSGEVDKVFGGSYNANVRGSVTINIKSGIYTSVYGGNDRKGTIGGDIIINIEEVDQCNPIIIQNLFGGGSQADYPGVDDDGNPAQTYKGESYPKGYKEHPDSYTAFTSGNIAINIKAATRIDRVFGGCDNAKATGTTAVNINMVKGSMAGNGFTVPASYTGDPIPNMHTDNAYAVRSGLSVGADVTGLYTRTGSVYTQIVSGTALEGVTYYEYLTGIPCIDDAVGTIGSVYGGGNQGDVVGSTTVNIGTETEIGFVNTPAHLTPKAKANPSDPDVYAVCGSNITGDVFGGGNQGDVTGNTTVNISTADFSSVAGFEGVSIGESVYGGGNMANVHGNTNVEMGGGFVLDGVYGGGLHGSVGTIATRASLPDGHPTHAGCVGGKPETFAAGTGKCTVVIRGGQVGPVEAAFTDGGMKNTGHYLLDAGVHHNPVDLGFVFGAGRGEVENPDTDPDADFRTYVKETEVIIKNSYAAGYEGGRADSLNHVLSKPIIMASVYGGGENGRVRGNTLVKIYGGQIGCGEGQTQVIGGKTVPKPYTELQWSTANPADFTECASWDYGTVVDGKTVYLPYDPMANVPYRNGSAVSNGSTIGSDGHTYYGYVFGGGSGYFPYEIKNPSGTVIGHDWLASAGVVEGSTKVLISGGHILTCVYGGNELTNVTGDSCVVIMSGGTLGVPRSNANILGKPVTCYLFGGGKGDQREHFKMYTNVKNTRVEVGGTARIFGSVFGGAEDGHVSGSAKVNIWGSARIGTNGTSYVDGNIFGGGRGFSGTELTAGTIKENATINISGTPTILGSVYGGGRLASLGVDFDGVQDATTGQFVEDGGGKTYGHVTINISGGIIGNATPPEDDEFSKSKYSGNVFGGSMGRLTLLDGAPNSLWSRMAQVKTSTVNITGGTIKRNVYGGAEYGTTRDNVYVTIGGSRNEETGVITPSAGTPVVSGSVFGGGLGSDIHSAAYNSHIIAAEKKYLFTPLQYAGCIGGDTYVNVVGKGHVNGSVYGGGDLASVGVIDYAVDNEDNYTQVIKHGSYSGSDETFYDFGLSWPYEFKYVEGITGGKTHVNVKGSAEVDNYVFGAGKGKVSFGAIDDIAEQRYTEAHLANVRETEVTIGTEGGYDNPQVRSVYGGGEDGHVNGNAKITIHRGTIRRSVFGAGKGDTQFTTYLLDSDNPGNAKATTDNVYSWTAGKVYGNTEVVMNGGSVGWFIYGGGNMASVGKGNYAGGSDDYAPDGYGELPSADGPLWTNTDFTESGQTTVTIMGGTLGAADAGLENGVPLGSVFGGSRGQTAKAEVISLPRYKYVPSFFLGYVNKTAINIGGTTAGGPTAGDGPIIYGCIYGGAQDGHVRNSTEVKIFKGDLRGQTGEAAERSGYVFGAGSGIGTYSPDGGANNYCNSASGSVTCTTLVEVRGTESTTKIKGSVYGGGALASVGPPQMGQPANEQKAPSEGHPSHSCNTVEIYGGAIGGSVYGASRGPGDSMFPLPFTGVSTAVDATADKYNPTMFATSLWTVVNVKGGTIAGHVYGGGEMGRVKESTEVHLTGGSIAHDAYGGGKGTLGDYAIAADVGGNATVELNEGVNPAVVGGCSVRRIFGCNDLNGSPRGHVKVHVHGTRHKNETKIEDKYTKFGVMKDYTITNYSSYKPDAPYNKTLAELATEAGLSTSTAPYTTYTGILEGAGSDEDKTNALDGLIRYIGSAHYDVLAVYGGGNLADYAPYGPQANNTPADFKATTEYAEVIIDGCQETSIYQVYGGSNAASTPGVSVRVNEAYEIHEVFGGGNGKDDYDLNGDYYENPGANVGYYKTSHHVTDGSKGDGSQADPYQAVENDGTGGYDDATSKAARQANYAYGTGRAHTVITGGRIHRAYGGSNIRGNIRTELWTQYENAGFCTMDIDESYGAGNKAENDGTVRQEQRCVDFVDQIFGGATNADVYSDIILEITNGTYNKVFGGNNTSGKVYGSITVNIKETGCKPIIIGELYGGGYLADYSIYGYKGDGSVRTKEEYDALSAGEKAAIEVKQNPCVNVISATYIGSVFGGGYQAKVVGTPHLNVNMENGTLAAEFMKKHPEYKTAEQTDATYTDVHWQCTLGDEVTLEDGSTAYNGVLPIGTIGNIFGGGNEADVYGNTSVEIGTGTHHVIVDGHEVLQPLDPARNVAKITESVYGGGNNGDITGNTEVTMGAGASVEDRLYGGGNLGGVGTVTTRSLPDGHASHANCVEGKPTAFAANTGRCTIVVDGGRVGPKNMTMPTDYGYIFGASRGGLTDPAVDKDIDFKAYVDETYVFVKNKYEDGYEGGAADSLAHIVSKPLICGGVYGGSENGRVLRDTHVFIRGGQIGIGRGKSDVYAEADFIDPTTSTAEEINAKAATMTECAAWSYTSPWVPYDEHAGDSWYSAVSEVMGAASTTGTDGHTFYGNVFGGGSGYFTYEKSNKSDGIHYEWLPSAGLVEGDTYLTISGGHILTNVYGGNEMTDVTGTCHVTMTGGTIGVPRTLTQISAHPLTSYIFGGGKGDQRIHFNKSTNVGAVDLKVTGGIIYGSVFGGAEDGHVKGNTAVTIGNDDHTGPSIGTWGTSYVEGNVFGAGRGFSGTAYTAGSIGGNVTLNIKGGTMLGSIYGGGRLASVGSYFVPSNHAKYGQLVPDGKNEDWNSDAADPVVDAPSATHGHITVNVTGGTIGNDYEFAYLPQATSAAIVDPSTGSLRYTVFEDYNNRIKKTYDSSKDIMTMEYELDGTTIKKELVYKVKHTKGGNVFAGGMGRRMKLDNSTPMDDNWWPTLGQAKSTKLTISGSPIIKGNVYGGGEMGSVTGYHTTKDRNNDDINVGTEVIITGGTIGSEITKDDITQYTFGSVYGGGMGLVYDNSGWKVNGGTVMSNTSVKISGADTKIWASVFGGGEMGIVEGSSDVDISGGEIGKSTLRDDGYVLFGSSYMGNVYGAGEGSVNHSFAGQVKRNTNIYISTGAGAAAGQPFIYHNIYGGGALGSVGTFRRAHVDYEGEDTDPAYIPSGIPYDWTANTGTATITIKGGTIGVSGRDNGMVNGSSRGDISAVEHPGYDTDPYDMVAWVNESVINIGTDDGSNNYTTPLITGNVYGGGENGRNCADSHVNIYDGTVGVVSGPWATIGDAANTRDVNNSRGGVYGAGCGQDTYTCPTDGKEYFNAKGGAVFGNTNVLIKGGLIARNVYGGGSMASVGTVSNVRDTTAVAKGGTGTAIHRDPANGFALSWPYKVEYVDNTGVTNVTIRGGHIGMGSDRIVGLDNGNVYGGSKGAAGDRYAMAHLANVKESHVTIDFPDNDEDPSTLVGNTHYDQNCIEGSVFGGGENGHLHGDTHVLLKDGFVSHSLFGGGRGEGKYKGKLIHVQTGDGYAGAPPKPDAVMTDEMDIFDWQSGKVFGNTHITMLDGRVLNNVLGGGYMASVGAGNYAGGDDDFYTAGYGETLTGHLWTSEAVGDDAWYFLNSGNTYVNLFGGVIGTADTWDGLPAGNIFGGSRGKAAPNLRESQRYLYCPEWFNGYVNETHITVGGGYRCTTSCTDKHSRVHDVDEIMSLQELQDLFEGTAYLDGNKMPVAENWTALSGGPAIRGSVYGGAQDGRVRRDTHVIINDGEIGYAYNATNQTTLGTSDLDDVQWRHRGNVYGAGSGLGKYEFNFNYDEDTNDTAVDYYGTEVDEKAYSQHAGCVLRYTQVDINGGEIHRNVYGGGSLASVGPPAIPPRTVETAYKRGTTTRDAAYGGGTIGQGWWSECAVNIAGTIGSHTDFQKEYGGEVYGASRGETELKDRESEFSYVIWTKVNVLRGAWVKGNVFGGGDSGMVKRDTEVNVGFPTAE